MSTRLYLQEYLRKSPNVGAVRLCNSYFDEGSVYVYVQDSNCQFNESFKLYISEFIAENFPCHLRYEIKPYSELMSNNVVPEVPLPSIIESLALNKPGCNNQQCKEKFQKAFPFIGDFQFAIEKFPIIQVKVSGNLSTYYRQMIEFYGKELITIGSYIKVVTP